MTTNPALVQLLLEMDRQQHETDDIGGSEIAWYYYRQDVEQVLGLPPGALDSCGHMPEADPPHENPADEALRSLHARLLAEHARLLSLASLMERTGEMTDAAFVASMGRLLDDVVIALHRIRTRRAEQPLRDAGIEL